MGQYDTYRNPDDRGAGSTNSGRKFEREGRVRAYNEAVKSSDFSREYRNNSRSASARSGARISARGDQANKIFASAPTGAQRKSANPSHERKPANLRREAQASVSTSSFARTPLSTQESMTGYAGRTRSVSIQAAIATRFGGVGSLICAALVIISLVVAAAIGTQETVSDMIAFSGPRTQQTALVNSIASTSTSFNDARVLAYDYTFPHGDLDGYLSSTSYSTTPFFEVEPAPTPKNLAKVWQRQLWDDQWVQKHREERALLRPSGTVEEVAERLARRAKWVTVEYPVGRPELSRIVDMDRSEAGIAKLIPLVIAAIALLVLLAFIKRGSKRLSLLRKGVKAHLEPRDRKATSMKVNNQTVYRNDYIFRTGDLSYPTKILSVHSPLVLQQRGLAVIYDAESPQRHLILQRLPGGLKLDRMGRLEARNPASAALATFAILGVIVALIVFGSAFVN